MTTRILLIEDNATNLELMLYLLDAYRYQAIACSTGKEGIETALRDPPDLIICDIQLLDLNGQQVMNQLKQHPLTKNIPIIAVTAYAMVGDRDSLLRSGFDGYISKPIHPEDFVGQVEEFLPSEKRTNITPAGHDTKNDDAEVPIIADKETILVVDDSTINRDLIKSTLQPSGYNLLLVSNVREALSVLLKTKPDLIISDLHMPYATGYDFLRQIKGLESFKNIPFLIITSSEASFQDRTLCLSMGAKAFVNRPIQPDALLKIIQECLK